ncbi:SHOCT domain-containing protein [Haloplasma contractile]|uniref:Membrane protein n=1 Tax=Haloplasma contractile SSD-17B TaxID=1033810 RepID=U2EBB5_9MOLU|nr:SHOCT domain-containing protein [Haloplasma contractile]ERJ12081.1 Putative membrane protein [Haloplasma contractile SSD-17B]
MMFGGLILLIVLVYILYHTSDNQTINLGNKNSSNEKSAIQMLNERYANGDIQEEEYIRKKELLSK